MFALCSCTQQFESHLVSLGDILEAIVTSQKRQLQMGVKVLPDLLQLVLRFHQRWNELKQVITTRHSTIERAMVKYNPENMGIASESMIYDRGSLPWQPKFQASTSDMA